METHSNAAPLRRESGGGQRVGHNQVIHVHPVHPGLGVPKPETEQPALHIHLERRESRAMRNRADIQMFALIGDGGADVWTTSTHGPLDTQQNQNAAKYTLSVLPPCRGKTAIKRWV